MNKEEFYSRTDIVDRYEGRRFGGQSGRIVHERELRAVRDLLPAGGKVLDVPVGTGRLSLYLREQGFDCHGMDYSESMLELCRKRGLSQLSQTDLFKSKLPAQSFDAVVSLRFHFHFRDTRPVLENVFNALKPGGVYVLDTFTRSPRAWLPFLAESGRVHLHTVDEFSQQARAVGFEVVQVQPCFLFSPLIYRFLPPAVVQTLDRLEPSVPPSWLARVFWQLRRPSDAAPTA